MLEEKTLLEQVRGKEVELAAAYARACADADAMKEAGAREAREEIERAGREGRQAAEALFEGAMDALEREIELVRMDARVQEAALRSAGETHVSEVVADLVRFVAPTSE